MTTVSKRVALHMQGVLYYILKSTVVHRSICYCQMPPYLVWKRNESSRLPICNVSTTNYGSEQ
jgi:hypothetical protein